MAAGRLAADVADRVLRGAPAAQRAATREPREVTQLAREAREQRRWLATAATCGVIGGLAMWTILIDRCAAWEAGQRLMSVANPAVFEGIVKLGGDQPGQSPWRP